MPQKCATFKQNTAQLAGFLNVKQETKQWVTLSFAKANVLN